VRQRRVRTEHVDRRARAETCLGHTLRADH
jgi:hypothetical protein